MGLFTIAGFNVGTYRSSDSNAERDGILAEWNDPDSDLGIFVANVNTSGTETIRFSCGEILVIGWLPDPKKLLDICVQHDHPEVTIHILKAKNSYHDQMEKVFTDWWSKGISSMDIPEWRWMSFHPGTRDICSFELAKTVFHQPFNRYAWIAQEARGISFSYHSDATTRLGHVFSMAARLIIHQHQDQEFWEANSPVLARGCLLFSKFFGNDIAAIEVEDYLTRTPEQLRKDFLPLFRAAMELARNEKGQMDNEDNQVVKEEDGGAGPKRKASNDGGHGGKKQKISAD